MIVGFKRIQHMLKGNISGDNKKRFNINTGIRRTLGTSEPHS